MWRRDKNHTAHVRSMIEDQRFLEKLFGLRRNIGLRGRFSKALAPDLVSDVCDHEPADHSAHAVTDEDDALAIRERARNRIQLLAEERRRVGIGITTRITVNPKLIASPDLRVIPQRVDHRRPASRRVLQTVDKNYRDPIWVERLQARESRGVSVLSRVEETS